MKFAVVNGQRQEAKPGLSGNCPCCDHPMTAKCGEVKIWHWAHQASLSCDPWWENETEWHRAWKRLFPEAWQEVLHQAEDGEKHIADVKTDHGWVIELQHSYIQPEERRSRDAFYPKLVWVVDGTRRKTDGAQFLNVWKAGRPIGANPNIRKAASNNCTLLREWSESRGLIFFDFGGEQLWWFFAKSADGSAYVAPFSRSTFVATYRNGATQQALDFEELVKDLGKLVSQYEAAIRTQSQQKTPAQPLSGFQQALLRRRKSQRRF